MAARCQRHSAAGARGKFTAIMDDLGFAAAAEAQADGRQYRLRLRHCPYREVALRHQDVICALHLGLMRGTLARMRAPVIAERLEAFAEPGVCVAWLSAGEQPGASQPGAGADQAARGAE